MRDGGGRRELYMSASKVAVTQGFLFFALLFDFFSTFFEFFSFF